MRNITFIILSIFLVIQCTNLYSQTYLMPTSMYMEIHTDSGILYDDGGSTGNYSTRVNATITIFPATLGGYVRISGQYSLEEWNKSRMLFYDGDTNSDNQICSISNSGCIDVRSNSGPLTIKFIVDTETPNSGFEFNIFTCNDIPYNIITQNITDSTSEIHWSENNTSTNWIVEISNGKTISLDTNFLLLDSLSSCTNYYYTIYSTCDTVGSNCNNKCGYNNYNNFLTTSSSTIYPLNVNYQSNCNDINLSWQETDTNITWIVNLSNGDSIITDNPYCSFDSLRSGEYYNVTIRASTSLSSLCGYSIGINTQCCCPIANNIQITSIGANSAIITWDADTNAIGWIVVYRIKDGINYDFDTIIVNTNSVSIFNLLPVRPYEVIIYSFCDNMNNNCSKTINFYTALSTINNCLSFTDLTNPNFFPSIGSYSNPYQYSSLVDYGYLSQDSRHTVHYDTMEVDPRTGGVLHTIPLGEEASVRLGNWLAGGEAESCTYAYNVDTNNYDMFLLKYAIVLEDPNHVQNQQPRFTLEILDSNYALVNDECGYTDFYASGDLGWNNVNGTNVIWKDWTSLGIDISKYHNQKIYIRFTTSDCNEGGHFGYAYFNIKCGNKYLNKNTCGYTDTLVFEAPVGFDYLWYSLNNLEDTISTDKQITVLVDNNTYYCRCSYKENNDCNFILSFDAERRFPFALFDYYLDTCGYKIHFVNKSIISRSDSIALGNEECTEVKWIFHDGTISFLRNPTFEYDSSGVFPVILITSLNNGACVDTIVENITINNFGFNRIEFTGDTIICNGSIVEISINEFDKYEWNTGDTTSSILISPSETSTYYLKAYENGCLRYDSITIYVTPYYFNDTINAVICYDDYYNLNGFTENKEGFYTKIYTAVNGCDSIINLDLKIAEEIENYSLIDDKYLLVEDFPILIDVSCDYCDNYYWNTGSRDSVLIINNYGSYYVNINHICGRIFDSIMIVRPDANIYIPNAFTPDLTINNTFSPIFENNNKIIIESFEIFNRWGVKIFSSNVKAWDGKYKNILCDNGVYVWQLLYKTKYTGDNIFEKKGEVNLIR